MKFFSGILITMRKQKPLCREIQQVVSEKFSHDKENFVPGSEILLLRKDIEIFRQEVKTGFAESESRTKSEIKKLIVWIIATVFGAEAIFITLAKVFFDK